MGGQAGDIGVITGNDLKADVIRCEKAPNGQTMHFVRIIKGDINKGDYVTLTVDKENRFTTCQNHTATHLLQRALKDVLGEEVSQAGSYLDAKTLRFDFKYTGKITDEDVIKTEERVNELIRENLPNETEIMDADAAKKTGAMALFGEKYGKTVRVVKFGPSKELCGGTHVTNTGNIRSFAIKTIESKGLNVYRIEAVCDTNLEIELFKIIKPYNDEMILLLKKAKKIVSDAKEDGIDLNLDVNISNERPKCYKDILENKEEVKTLRKQIANLEKEYKDKLASLALSKTDSYLEEKTSGIYGDVIIKVFDDSDINTLKQLAGSLINKMDKGIVLLINKKDNSLNFVAKESLELKEVFNVGDFIKNISKIADGNGGGSALFAQGGGTNVDKLDMILTYAKGKIVKE